MNATPSMWRLKVWLQINAIPESTYHHLRKHHPDQVPETIVLGKRARYVTAEADRAFRERRMAESRAVAGS